MKKILIVDDQDVIRELVSLTLEVQPQTSIIQATNGDDALQLARQEHPDLILLDVQMPGGSLDGLDVCRILKREAATRDIRIIMLTSKSFDKDKQAGREAGADGYFAKPFSPLDLITTVEHFLG